MKLDRMIMLCLAVGMLWLASCEEKKTMMTNRHGQQVEVLSSDFDFIKELDIKDFDSLVVATEFPIVPPDSVGSCQPVLLTPKQSVSLLGGVFECIELREHDVYLKGIKALPMHYTLALLMVKTRDNASDYVCIYDNKGNRTDVMRVQMGWHSVQHVPVGLGNSWLQCSGNTECTFSSTTAFELREGQEVTEVKKAKGNTGYEPLAHVSSLKRVKRYFINARGHLVAQDVRVDQCEGYNPSRLVELKMSDIESMPHSSADVLDRLSQLRQFYNSVHDGIDGSGSDIDSRMKCLLECLYREDAQRVLKWLATNKGINHNALLNDLESLIDYNSIEKSKLVADIAKVSNAQARAYLQKVTAHWGENWE